jgi:dTDP-4-dehydrorhamnose 3,5-epimerase
MAMRFTPTTIEGVVLIDLEPIADERGNFARAFSKQEFARAGLNTEWPEHNLSFNRKRGTLRGLHYQRAPHQETRVVRCVAGAIFDVAVDIRPTSPTRGKWIAQELSAANGRALYIPMGCAHGFQSLVDDSAVLYLMSATYESTAAAGIRHDDPEISVAWPLADRVVSMRDKALPLLAGIDYRGAQH